jgi:integrase
MRRANALPVEKGTKTGTLPALLPRIRFHDRRHSAASLLLMAGENIKVVSERLGHEDIEIILRTYAHVLPTMQKGAAAKMNRIFTGGAGKKAAEG